MSRIITYDDLRNTIIAAGVRPEVIRLPNTAYMLATPEWIQNGLGASMKAFLDRTGLQWANQRFACSKFSMTSAVIAAWCHAMSTTEEASLALGVFDYFSLDMFTMHEVAFAAHVDASGKLYLAWYEPQPNNNLCMTTKNLLPDEVQSCLFCACP